MVGLCYLHFFMVFSVSQIFSNEVYQKWKYQNQMEETIGKKIRDISRPSVINQVCNSRGEFATQRWVNWPLRDG